MSNQQLPSKLEKRPVFDRFIPSPTKINKPHSDLCRSGSVCNLKGQPREWHCTCPRQVLPVRRQALPLLLRIISTVGDPPQSSMKNNQFWLHLVLDLSPSAQQRWKHFPSHNTQVHLGVMPSRCCISLYLLGPVLLLVSQLAAPYCIPISPLLFKPYSLPQVKVSCRQRNIQGLVDGSLLALTTALCVRKHLVT